MELPIGLGMALCQNPQAAEYFYSLSDADKKAIIDRTHNIKSPEEMHVFVSHLTGQGNGIQ